MLMERAREFSCSQQSFLNCCRNLIQVFHRQNFAMRRICSNFQARGSRARGCGECEQRFITQKTRALIRAQWKLRGICRKVYHNPRSVGMNGLLSKKKSTKCLIYHPLIHGVFPATRNHTHNRLSRKNTCRPSNLFLLHTPQTCCEACFIFVATYNGNAFYPAQLVLNGVYTVYPMVFVLIMNERARINIIRLFKYLFVWRAARLGVVCLSWMDHNWHTCSDYAMPVARRCIRLELIDINFKWNGK